MLYIGELIMISICFNNKMVATDSLHPKTPIGGKNYGAIFTTKCGKLNGNKIIAVACCGNIVLAGQLLYSYLGDVTLYNTPGNEEDFSVWISRTYKRLLGFVDNSEVVVFSKGTEGTVIHTFGISRNGISTIKEIPMTEDDIGVLDTCIYTSDDLDEYCDSKANVKLPTNPLDRMWVYSKYHQGRNPTITYLEFDTMELKTYSPTPAIKRKLTKLAKDTLEFRLAIIENRI
jgi:hypothetical protein